MGAMKQMVRAMVVAVVVAAAMWAVGRVTSERFEEGTDPDDDEFRLMAFLGGKQVRSQATALRAVKAVVRVGGIDLDLSEATLDRDGAHLDIQVTAGGLRVAVDPSWRVYVVQDVSNGEVEVDLPDPDTLPDDAPVLTVQATVSMGGVMIEAG